VTGRRALAAWLTVLALAPAGAARAQESAEAPSATADAAPPPVAVTATLGLGGKLPTSGFARLSVELTSDARHEDVTVEVRPEDGDEVLATLGPVTLEGGAARRLARLVPAHRFVHVDTLAIHVQGPDGEALGRASLTPDAAHGRLLLVLDRRGAPPTDLSQLGHGRARRQADAWAAVSVADAEELPSTALGYSGVDAVLLGDLDLERWSDPQASSLAGWVVRGGRLVIALDGGGARLRKSALGRALGQGLAALPYEAAPILGTEVTLAGVVAAYGDPRELPTLRPPFLAPLTPGPRETVLLRDDAARPLAVRRAHGRGDLTLVGCDLWEPPFVHQAFTASVLSELLRDTPEVPPRSELLFDVLKEVRQPAQVGGVFALLVVFALVAGPGAYFALKAKDRGLLVWAVIPALTAAFTLLVPLYRLALRDAESTLVGARLIELSAGADVALDTADVLLFSGSPDTKTVVFRGGDATAHGVVPPKRLFRHQRSRALPLPGGALGGAPREGGLEFPLPVALWGTRYVTFTRTTPAPRIEGSLEVGLASSGAQRLRLRLRSTGVTLSDPVVVCPTRPTPTVLALEDALRAGQAVDLSAGAGVPIGAYDPPGEGIAPQVLARVLQGPVRERVEQGGAYLLATLARPSPVQASPNVRARLFGTVVAVELPVSFADEVPFGVARQRTSAATVADIDSQTVVRELTTRFELPRPPVAPGHDLVLRVRAATRAALAAVALEGRFHDAGGAAWRPVPLELPRGRDRQPVSTTVLAPAAGWLDPEGVLVLRQRFERGVADSDRDAAALLDAAIARRTDDPEDE